MFLLSSSYKRVIMKVVSSNCRSNLGQKPCLVIDTRSNIWDHWHSVEFEIDFCKCTIEFCQWICKKISRYDLYRTWVFLSDNWDQNVYRTWILSLWTFSIMKVHKLNIISLIKRSWSLIEKRYHFLLNIKCHGYY